MGILFKISTLWFSMCMVFLMTGGALGLTKEDYIGFSLGLAIGILLILLCILLEQIFPNNGGWI